MPRAEHKEKEIELQVSHSSFGVTNHFCYGPQSAYPGALEDQPSTVFLEQGIKWIPLR